MHARKPILTKDAKVDTKYMTRGERRMLARIAKQTVAKHDGIDASNDAHEMQVKCNLCKEARGQKRLIFDGGQFCEKCGNTLRITKLAKDLSDMLEFKPYWAEQEA